MQYDGNYTAQSVFVANLAEPNEIGRINRVGFRWSRVINHDIKQAKKAKYLSGSLNGVRGRGK